MRAIVLEKFGGLDSLVYRDIPEPEPKAGHVVIEIKAFGINHAEIHMRRGEWAEAAEVSGIECVGIVKSCPGGEFPVGAKVAALMGGFGPDHQRQLRRVYACAGLECRVDRIRSSVGRTRGHPRDYATAWTCLFRNLEIQKGQLLLIRGATSSFGLAAVNMAVNAGARVIATTRSKERFAKLEALASSGAKLRGRKCQNGCPKQRRSTQSSTLLATAQLSIHSTC